MRQPANHTLAKKFKTYLVLITWSEWPLPVCKNYNGSL